MNDMSSCAVIPVVNTPPVNFEPLTNAPLETALPRISGERGFVAAYLYRWADRTPAMLIGRYEMVDANPDRIKKFFYPYTPWQNADGDLVWVRKGMGGERPLYNLPELVEREKALVLISEGEKCADAVKAAFPNCVSTTWSGGTNSLNKSDFDHLRGRSVVIFPDHDDPGRQAADTIQAMLAKIGAKRIRVLDIAGLGDMISKDVPKGYDIADAIADGLTESKFKNLVINRPDLFAEFNAFVSAAVGPDTLIGDDKKATQDAGDVDAVLANLYKEWGEFPDMPDGFTLSEAGVYRHSVTSKGVDVSTFAGSPLAVVRRSHGGSDGKGWGYVVTFLKQDETWGTCIIPGRLLAGDGKEMREILADNGYTCPQDRAGRQALAEYIVYSKPAYFAEIVSRPGWHGESFVLPQGVISPAACNRQVQLDMQGRAHLFARKGTLENWQMLAKVAQHSSRAAFVLALAFVAPLLRPLTENGGGFHLFGRSSRGKTTLLRLAGSVWGGGGRDGFVNAWRATTNGIEGLAADHNDVLLVECPHRVVQFEC